MFNLLLYYFVDRFTLKMQLQATTKSAHGITQRKRPNMVVATGYGAIVVLRNPFLRRLPCLFVSPGVGKYRRYMRIKNTEDDRKLTLQDISCVSIAHDRHEKSVSMKDSLELVDTAPPGSGSIDVFSRSKVSDMYEDEAYITELIVKTFCRGWLALAQREGASILYDEKENNFHIAFTDVSNLKPGEPRFFTEGNSTSWLDQNDLKIIFSSMQRGLQPQYDETSYSESRSSAHTPSIATV